MELTRIYKLIPYLLIALALGAIAFLLITGNTALLIKSPIFILLAFIIGSLFIILTKKHHSESINVNKIANLNLPQRTLRRIFVIVGALMMITVLLGLKNSVIFIVLLIILAVCIILQILSKNVSAPWVIGELLYVVGMLVFPHMFEYAYYYSDTDIMYHAHYTQTILDTGFFDSFISANSIYSIFPGFHLILSESSLLSSLAPNVCQYIYLTLGYLGLSIFVYLIVKQFFPSKTICLLALFIYLIPAFATPRYTWGQPSVLLGALALMLLYLVFRKDKSDKLQFFILSIPFVGFCLLSHHASQLPILGILLFLFFVDFAIIPLFTQYKHGHVINIPIILLYVIVSISYIIYNYLRYSVGYVGIILDLINGGTSAAERITTLSAQANPSDILYQICNASGIWLCIIPALIGMYLLLIWHNQSRRQYFLGFSMLILFILFANVTGVIPGLNGLYLYRYYNIIATIFVGGIVFGGIFIISKIQPKCRKKHFGQIIIISFCLLLLVSPCTVFATENDVLKPLNIVENNTDALSNNHFTTGEMSMINYISENISKNTVYSTDNGLRGINTWNVISPNQFISLSALFVNQELSESTLQEYSYIYLRNHHITERGGLAGGHKDPIKGSSNIGKNSITIKPTEESLTNFARNTKNHNIIYTNGGSTIYAI